MFHCWACRTFSVQHGLLLFLYFSFLFHFHTFLKQTKFWKSVFSVFSHWRIGIANSEPAHSEKNKNWFSFYINFKPIGRFDYLLTKGKKKRESFKFAQSIRSIQCLKVCKSTQINFFTMKKTLLHCLAMYIVLGINNNSVVSVLGTRKNYSSFFLSFFLFFFPIPFEVDKFIELQIFTILSVFYTHWKSLADIHGYM